MKNDKKHIVRETSRWLRVGVLSLSVLGPIINTVATRLRQRAQSVQEVKKTDAFSNSPEKPAAVSATFWVIFGFSVGLTVAGITAYQLIRRRIQQQSTEEEPSIQLSQNGHLNQPGLSAEGMRDVVYPGPETKTQGSSSSE